MNDTKETNMAQAKQTVEVVIKATIDRLSLYKTRLDIIGQAEMMGRATSRFHRKLVQGGVSLDVADDLTAEYGERLLTNALPKPIAPFGNIFGGQS